MKFDDTIELIKKAQTCDENSKEVLLKENSPLIKSVIKRFIGKGIEYDDLYQLGSLGLLKAIYNFDISFNVRFSTYAVPMIAGEIKRYLRDNGIIKVSRNVKTLNIHINKFIDDYIKTNSKSPTIEEIAKYFNIEKQEVVFAMESNIQPMSLSINIGEDEANNKQSILEKIEFCSIDNDMDVFLIKKIISKLSDRDKKIIILRYFREKTQKEVAEIIGVSQVQVSRLENKILKDMKEMIG